MLGLASDCGIGAGMDITIMLSFRRNGEIFGGRITYQTPNVSEEQRAVYYTALAATIRRCSPLPLSKSLGRCNRRAALHLPIFTTTESRERA